MITGSSAAVELRARTTATRTCYEYESLLASDIREKKELKQRVLVIPTLTLLICIA